MGRIHEPTFSEGVTGGIVKNYGWHFEMIGFNPADKNWEKDFEKQLDILDENWEKHNAEYPQTAKFGGMYVVNLSCTTIERYYEEDRLKTNNTDEFSLLNKDGNCLSSKEFEQRKITIGVCDRKELLPLAYKAIEKIAHELKRMIDRLIQVTTMLSAMEVPNMYTMKKGLDDVINGIALARKEKEE